MPNQFHQPAHPFFAAWAERCDNFVIAQPGCKRLDRHREVSRIHTQAGESSTRSENAECALKGGLGTQRLDRYIDAPSASEMLDTLDHVFFGEVDHNVRAHAF